MLREIKRRSNLTGFARNQKGNKLRIIDDTTGLIAPNDDETSIDFDEDESASCNGSSLVIQWSITVNAKASKVLLGGDATAAIWERLNGEKNVADLEWHILVAPNHCSRYTLWGKNL